mmetsp:Transcript_34947/g.87948  ORF Transcript_34947/g.87948 Transcript_34947/m.87948 type:complete len:516 (+) Transcript_34947:1-1548(+)
MGLDDRLGKLAVGFDADVVVWDRHPFNLGARPSHVFIDGVLEEQASRDGQGSYGAGNFNLEGQGSKVALHADGQEACTADVDLPEYALLGVDLWDMVECTNATVRRNVTIVVRDGNVQCVGPRSQCPYSESSAVYGLEGGIVVPALIEAAAPLGHVDIGEEDATGDGDMAQSDFDSVLVEAADGVAMQTRHLHAALAGGVATAITRSSPQTVLNGLGAAFHTLGESTDDALVSRLCGFHVTLGNAAKGDVASISAQLSRIRNMFAHASEELSALSSPPSPASSPAASTPPSPTGQPESPADSSPSPPQPSPSPPPSPSQWQPFEQLRGWQRKVAMVLLGTAPLVVHTHAADVISAVLRLKADFRIPRVVIVGGAEAHVVRARLAREKVDVVLSPPRCLPNTFPTRRCRADGARRLVDAGVRVGLAYGDVDNVRNLRWEAGLAMRWGGLTYQEALASVTCTIADAHRLDEGFGRVILGRKALFAAFDGDPLSLGSHTQLVAVGKRVRCRPHQLFEG